MKRILQFEAPFTVITKTNEILEVPNEHISFNSKVKNLNLKVDVFQDFTSKMEGNLSFNGASSIFEVNSQKTAFFNLSKTFFNEKLILSGFLTTPKYSSEKHRKIYLPKTVASTFINYVDPEKQFSALFGIGITKDKAPVTTINFSKGIYNCALKAIVTDRTNLVYATALVGGFFGSAKCDISLNQFQGFDIGYFLKKNNLSCFGYYDTAKSVVEIGGYGQNNNKEIAFKGKYSIKSKEYFTEIGGSYKAANGSFTDKAYLSGKINSKSQIQFLTKFSPKPWVDITFLTRSGILNKSKPVIFGWSLDFHKDFNNDDNNNK